MKQLIKNELIKLRAQKTYLVLSCIVLALVMLVCFFTSVAMTPFMNFMNNGREFITRSAAYEKVVDFLYENPDHALAGVLRTLFRDPKSDGDAARKEAVWNKALEKIAENMLNRVDVAERELSLQKEQLAMYKKQIADAEKEAKDASLRSWISITISVVAVIVSIAVAVL